jgi:hypothetical protein
MAAHFTACVMPELSGVPCTWSFGMRRAAVIAGLAAALAACSNDNNVITGPNNLTPPANLTYQLEPSGDPTTPEGILLRWDPTTDNQVTNYVVYSRSSSNAAWVRRAATTSASFEDRGTPDLQYEVTAQAQDGSESQPSNVVTVDASNQLDPPSQLVSFALDQAVQLSWSTDARLAAPSLFAYYRVYSTDYDLDNNVCSANWVLEGTTVSEDFIVSGIPNGVPRCFTVSTISVDGHESDWATPVAATPRVDAQNQLVYDAEDHADSSGFAFLLASSGQFGVILPGSRTDVDFRVDRHSDGSMWMTPVRSGSVVTRFGDQPVPDLTSIDLAPEAGFSSAAIQARAGYGYVFQTTQADGLHFAGMRVAFVGPTYVIFDWSYQTDPGNPMLRRVR